MADNQAHDAAGPGSDPVDAAFPAAVETGSAADIAAAEADAPPPSFAEYTSASASDVELLGRNTVPEAQLGGRVADPILVGAASATSANGHGATGVMGPREADSLPEQRPASKPGDDLPIWSFREGAARDEVVPPVAPPVARHQAELPLAAPPEREAAAELAARPHPLFGPIGRPRSAAVVPLLAVVTLGVYALVWHRRANRELEEFDPKLHSRPMRSTVAVAIPWLAGLLVTLAGAVLIVAERLSIHLPLASHVTSVQADYMLAGLAAVPYLILLVPFSLVAVVMTLERLRSVEEHVGTTTDRQVRTVGTTMLMVIPVIGGLVLLGVAQRRLNAVWDAVAPAGRLFH